MWEWGKESRVFALQELGLEEWLGSMERGKGRKRIRDRQVDKSQCGIGMVQDTLLRRQRENGGVIRRRKEANVANQMI